ncbi:MAG TPA: ABC transporter substrate-binding protein [Chloroflexota bacterium]|nr:ABC transporter substrate-binding protein [Chloroflexota bacterium]
MHLRAVAPVVLVLAALSGLMGCTGAGSAGRGSSPQPAAAERPAQASATPSPPMSLRPVKLSYVNALDQAPLFWAIDRGYFEAQGIELQTEPVQSAADAIAFLANGQLDVAMGAIAVPLFNAVYQGLDVRIIAPVAYVARNAVLVRKDLWDSGVVRSVADFRGRRVYSVAPGSGAVYIRTQVLENAGLRPEDVEAITMPLQDAPLAMANRQIDGGVFSDPWATRMLLEGSAVALDPGPLPERLSIVLMAGSRLREAEPELGRRFLLAYLRAVRELQTDEQLKSDAATAVFARWTGNQPELVRQLQYLPRFEPNFVIDTDSLLDQQRVHIASRATTYTDPLPAERLIDTRLADYAVAQLGRWPAGR